MEENSIYYQLETEEIDGSNLTVNNTVQDALNLVYEKILLVSTKIENISLKNGILTDFLVEGANTLKVEYQINNRKKLINCSC